MKKLSPVIFAIIFMAIILAVGSFLAISYVQRRPAEAPAPAGGDNVGGVSVNVEGIDVQLRGDLIQQVRIINPADVQTIPLATDAATDQNQTVDGGQDSQNPPADQQNQQTEQPTPFPTNTPEPPPLPAAEPIITIDYVVQEGDTLYKIADLFNTAIVLMAERGISQDDLVAGQTIAVPVGNAEICPGRQPYVVKEAETAFAIGQKFGVNAEEIQAINGLDENYTVYAGTVICVP